MNPLRFLIIFICINSLCFGDAPGDEPVILAVLNEFGGLLPTGVDNQTLPTIKNLQALAISGKIAPEDKVLLDIHHWLCPQNAKCALLFMVRGPDGIIRPRSHRSVIGFSQKLSEISNLAKVDSELTDRLVDIMLNEKDMILFDHHAKGAVALGLSKYYLPKVMIAQESDPIRRLLLALVALNGGGASSLSVFGADLEKMPETFRNYKGSDQDRLEGIIMDITLEVKSAVTEESFDLFWKIGAKQDEAFRAKFIQRLVFSITSGRELPVTLLESHRTELVQLIKEDSVVVGFEAFNALSLLDKRADAPRNLKDFIKRRTEIISSL